MVYEAYQINSLIMMCFITLLSPFNWMKWPQMFPSKFLPSHHSWSSYLILCKITPVWDIQSIKSINQSAMKPAHKNASLGDQYLDLLKCKNADSSWCCIGFIITYGETWKEICWLWLNRSLHLRTNVFKHLNKFVSWGYKIKNVILLNIIKNSFYMEENILHFHHKYKSVNEV